MTYRGLGNRRAIGIADVSGVNPGFFTCEFPASLIAVRVAWFEIYHITMENIPSATTVTVTVGAQTVFTRAQLSDIGDWDPAQPMLLEPGQDVLIQTTIPIATTPPPAATIWLRHDIAFASG